MKFENENLDLPADQIEELFEEFEAPEDVGRVRELDFEHKVEILERITGRSGEKVYETLDDLGLVYGMAGLYEEDEEGLEKEENGGEK